MGLSSRLGLGPTFMVTPFGIDDELELRSYGDLGTLFTPRVVGRTPNFIWPATLGNQSGSTVVGNFDRGNYTAYSYSRELRPFLNVNEINPAVPSPAYTLTTPSGTNFIWPPFPARVSAAPDLATASSDAAAELSVAMAATNIASAMEFVNYTPQEARAFAANYMTFRWNSWTSNVVAGQTIWSLPDGPSTFIDASGVCFRGPVVASVATAADFGPAGNDLHAEDAKIYLSDMPCAARFINEIAATVTTSVANVNSISDSAIELYNPYPVNLDLADYEIRIITAANPNPHSAN